MKITLSIDIEDVLKKPVDEMDDDDEKAIEDSQSKLPTKKNEVVLPEEEAQVEPPDTKPVKYTVQKGDTLRKIAQKYSVSFGELTNYLMSKNGTTMLAPGMEIEIPRHFIDLSQA